MKKSSEAGQKVSSAVLSLTLHVLIGLMIGRHLPHPVLLQALYLAWCWLCAHRELAGKINSVVRACR